MVSGAHLLPIDSAYFQRKNAVMKATQTEHATADGKWSIWSLTSIPERLNIYFIRDADFRSACLGTNPHLTEFAVTNRSGWARIGLFATVENKLPHGNPAIQR
jgi:hypothetical protein